MSVSDQLYYSIETRINTHCSPDKGQIKKKVTGDARLLSVNIFHFHAVFGKYFSK